MCDRVGWRRAGWEVWCWSLLGRGEECGGSAELLSRCFEACVHAVEEYATRCAAVRWWDVQVEHDEHVGFALADHTARHCKLGLG
jgi:hypothetical protein